MEEVAIPKKTKCRNILGWLKQIYYILCWIFIAMFVKFGTYVERINYYWHVSVSIRYKIEMLVPFIISMIVMGMIYLVNLIFLCVGANRVFKLLSNKQEDISINKIIDNLLKEKPEVIINCVCYHMETRAYTTTDSNGRTQTNYTTVMVPTYSESKNLDIFSYLDISGIFKLKDTTKKYIQLELGKEINFNDELTLYDIETIKNDMCTRNRYRDAYITISVNRVLPSFKEFYLVRLTNKDNCFIKKWIYIISMIITLDKFYELYFDSICSSQFFVIKKIVSSRQNVLENPTFFKKYFKILLDSLNIDSSKVLIFIEFLYKSYNENFVSTFKEETEENKKKLTSFLEKNQSSIYQEILNLSKLRATRKNSESKLNNTYNSADEDFEELPEEIMNFIESNDLEGFKTSLDKNKNLIPSFLFLLSDNEFTDIKYIEIIINFTYALLSASGDTYISDLDKCIELFINQVIHIILTNLKNENIIKIANDILVMTPMKLNSEKFFKTISQYLNIKSDDVLLGILLRSIKNFILDNKTKFLEKVLPYFAENLLGLINHSTKEIKEEAVHCCVEIIMVVGYKFDNYLELLPKNQQNLINFFIKKRTG